MTKFLVDRMLGQTAKWLRLMGIDAEYAENDISDEELLEKAKEEDRILITRDKELGKNGGVVLVTKKPPEELIPSIIKEFDVDIEPMTRCSKCNSKVETIDKEKVKDKVPSGIYEKQDGFWICDGCGQIYWQGSHWEHIIETVENIKAKVDK